MSSSFWGLICALRSRTKVAHKCEAAFLRVRERACQCERVCEKDRGRVPNGAAPLTCFRIGRCCGTRSTGPARSRRARAWPPASPPAPPKSDGPGAGARSRHDDGDINNSSDLSHGVRVERGGIAIDCGRRHFELGCHRLLGSRHQRMHHQHAEDQRRPARRHGVVHVALGVPPRIGWQRRF